MRIARAAALGYGEPKTTDEYEVPKRTQDIVSAQRIAAAVTKRKSKSHKIQL